ncbi:hypothetical protein [Niveispirillum sp.]|uniref:hypothetical protein n=1 Tax=Niveispirillum sp. TaxID=1917217 RepID=UPI001B68A5AA|nr:hypothetical protein [Niveispirillum sp.]MBP7335159.1 hypothetical protein [Niveispirillum sp.]
MHADAADIRHVAFVQMDGDGDIAVPEHRASFTAFANAAVSTGMAFPNIQDWVRWRTASPDLGWVELPQDTPLSLAGTVGIPGKTVRLCLHFWHSHGAAPATCPVRASLPVRLSMADAVILMISARYLLETSRDHLLAGVRELARLMTQDGKGRPRLFLCLSAAEWLLRHAGLSPAGFKTHPWDNDRRMQWLDHCAGFGDIARLSPVLTAFGAVSPVMVAADDFAQMTDLTVFTTWIRGPVLK